MIRILIVDDHYMMRQAIETLLNSVDDMAVVGHAVNGLEALNLCQSLQPDVVLMDVDMPEMDGLTATRIIRRAHPNIKIILMTSLSTLEEARATIRVGAHVFLPKFEIVDGVLDTVRSVCRSS